MDRELGRNKTSIDFDRVVAGAMRFIEQVAPDRDFPPDVIQERAREIAQNSAVLTFLDIMTARSLLEAETDDAESPT